MNIALRPVELVDTEWLSMLQGDTSPGPAPEACAGDESPDVEVARSSGSPANESAVIVADQTNVGVVAWRFESNSLHLADIRIQPTAQSHGIGTIVIEILMRQAATHGMPLHVCLPTHNTRARRLFVRLGFSSVSFDGDCEVLLLRNLIFVRPFFVGLVGKGTIWGMSYPGSYGPKQQSIAELTTHKVTSLVGLLEPDEITRLGLTQLPMLCSEHGIDYLTYPIRDRSVPTDIVDFRKLCDRLVGLLKQGQNVAVHCKAGIGRTGLLLACLLGQAEVDLDRACKMVTDARGWTIPDTQDQLVWLRRHWNDIAHSR